MARIVAQVNSRTGQVIILASQLLIIQALNRFVIDSSNGVAVRKDLVPVRIEISFQDRRLADATSLQKQSATRNFRVFFFSPEPVEERHTRQGFLEREVVDEGDATSEAFLITPSCRM